MEAGGGDGGGGGGGGGLGGGGGGGGGGWLGDVGVGKAGVVEGATFEGEGNPAARVGAAEGMGTRAGGIAVMSETGPRVTPAGPSACNNIKKK